MKYRNKVNGTIIDVDAEITGGVWEPVEAQEEAQEEVAQEEAQEEEAQEEVAQEEPEKEKPARKKKGQS